MEPDFSGDSKAWSSETKYKSGKYWPMVCFPLDNPIFAIPSFEDLLSICAVECLPSQPT